MAVLNKIKKQEKDDRQPNLSLVDEITTLTPLYEEQGKAILFIIDEGMADLILIIPLILCLIASIFHIPLLIRVLSISFSELDYKKYFLRVWINKI